jgi:hypothetical protein
MINKYYCDYYGTFRVATKRPLLPAKLFAPLVSAEIGMSKILSTIDRRRRKQLKREIRRQDRERRTKEANAPIRVPLPCWPESPKKED